MSSTESAGTEFTGPERGHWSSRLWVRLTAVNVLALSLVFVTLVGFILYRSGVVLAHLPIGSFLKVQDTLNHDFWRGLLSLLEEVYSQVAWTLAAALLLALLSALLLSAAYTRYLNTLVQAIRRLATGDFRVRVADSSSVHELRLLQRDLNRTAARLEHLERERQFESAAIAHELRTPLTALRLRIQGLQEGVLPLSPDELTPLNVQLGHLDRLAEALMTLTLADAGRLPLDIAPVHIGVFLTQLGELFQGVARAKHLRLELHGPEDTVFPGDAHQLRKAVGNLVENAIKYTPDGGRIEVRAVVTDVAAEFRIVDTGPGVSPEALGQLFRRFYRTETSRTRTHGGSGLGLAIADVIVRAHGGRLSALAAPHAGLELRIWLPLSSAPKP